MNSRVLNLPASWVHTSIKLCNLRSESCATLLFMDFARNPISHMSRKKTEL
jgi:hypothetical protein